MPGRHVTAGSQTVWRARHRKGLPGIGIGASEICSSRLTTRPTMCDSGGGLAWYRGDGITSSCRSTSVCSDGRGAALDGAHRMRWHEPPRRTLPRPTSRPGLGTSAPGDWWCRRPTTADQPCCRCTQDGVDVGEQRDHRGFQCPILRGYGWIMRVRRRRHRGTRPGQGCTFRQHLAPADQASMTCFSLMACTRSPWSIAILRGLARSATGIRNRSTPAW